MLHALLDRLERTEAIDRLAEPIAETVRPALRSQPLSRLLSGAWLGHRVHPLLTDAVIGPWLSASVLDAVGGRAGRVAARRLVGLGILSAGPTVATGLHDWMDYGTRVRRAGAVHALANAVGLTLQVASWIARRNGAHRRGAWLSLAAMGATGAGGYLGGHLTYALGAGVERTAFDTAPSSWTPALPLSELPPGVTRSVEVDGTPILLIEDRGEVRALADTCGHAGCSLAEGDVVDGAITCPCHGSRYRLSDGKTLAGPASAAQPAFDTRVREGVVEVRERRPASSST